jgi:hypothetical protein
LIERRVSVHVFDLWAIRWRRRKAAGDMIIVRYADDFIVGFQHERDARSFLDEMRERLREFALSLHPRRPGSSSSDALRRNAASAVGSGAHPSSERTKLHWERMKRLIDEWLPKPRILHPWPDNRFAVSHPR